MVRVALVVGLVMSAFPAGADEPASHEPASHEAHPPHAPAEAWKRPGLRFAVLPEANFSTDEGVGGGVLATFYKYDGHTAPYVWRLTAQAFLTTRGVHSHYIDIDALHFPGPRFRLTSRVKFAATNVENWCGVGGSVTCDPAQAASRAASFLPSTATAEDIEEFEARYYLARVIEPYWVVNLRYRVREKPKSVELVAGYRLSLFFPGDLNEAGPYPGSLYAEAYPEGEVARTGVLQFGVVADTRDNEPSPQRGHWLEASVRAAAPFLGSTADTAYVGVNLNLRAYATLIPDGRLSFANRVILDAIAGTASTQELTWFGGTQVLQGLGGLNAGRGIRQRRYRGPLKAIEQAELRARLFTVHLGFTADVYFVAFGELAWVSDYAAFTGATNGPTDPDRSPIHAGEGFGFRVAFDQNFVVRADMAFSQDEGFSPSVYLDVDNLF